jgi:hypothetical protein
MKNIRKTAKPRSISSHWSKSECWSLSKSGCWSWLLSGWMSLSKDWSDYWSESWSNS